jgi:hypothetical protein
LRTSKVGESPSWVSFARMGLFALMDL